MTSRHNNAPRSGPTFVKYLKLSPCGARRAGRGLPPSRGGAPGRANPSVRATTGLLYTDTGRLHR